MSFKMEGVFKRWAASTRISMLYIQLGKSSQNAFTERFKRTYRREDLVAHLFMTTQQVQAITDEWLMENNEYRPSHWMACHRCNIYPD